MIASRVCSPAKVRMDHLAYSYSDSIRALTRPPVPTTTDSRFHLLATNDSSGSMIVDLCAMVMLYATLQTGHDGSRPWLELTHRSTHCGHPIMGQSA